MNGVHDMGGAHGHGPLVVEPDEPVFHAAWEGRVWAMARLCLRAGLFNTDELRWAIERMPPAGYLDASYYERWLTAVETLAGEKGVTGPGPVRSSGRNPACATPPPPRFRAGDRVRTRNMHPAGHTRLPWYARAREGVVVRVHRPALLPDTNVGPASRDWEPVYGVRFESRELWGEQGHGGDEVVLDVFERYLETPAPEDAR